MSADRPPISMCFGGGGAFAYGFDMGVAVGMGAEGIDLSGTPMIGTSAGSHAVATLGAGMTFDHVATLWSDYIAQEKRRMWVRASGLSESVYGTATTADVGAVAVRLLTFKRAVLWSNEHRLADVVAASCSAVPLTRPHRVGRRRYLDGGWRSVASADLAPAADVLVLCTPFASPAQGYLGRSGARQARKEIARWRATTGGDVLHVEPTEEMISIPLKGWSSLGDMNIGRQVFELAVPLGRDVATILRRDYSEVAARL